MEINNEIMLHTGAEQEANKVSTQETATFLTRSLPAITNRPKLPQYDGVLTGSSEIIDFCKRPVEIGLLTPSASFAPWDLWLANSAVAAKLRNYYFIRGTMNMRFLVNAQPFWYGRYLVYLKPYSFTLNPQTLTYGALSAYSSDYKVEIDLTTNQSVDLSIPYMNITPFYINDGAHISAVNFAIDPLFGPYDSQSAGAVSPTVRVYAWVTDLQLGIPVAQSANGVINAMSSTMDGIIPPEQRNGAISGPLTAVSKIATNFEKIPVIGGIAKMGSGIANIAGGFASLLGFSKPTTLEEPTVIVYKTVPNMAVCHGKDSTYKLTVDPRHEKSIDPQSVDGTSHDSMSFASILGRPGLLPIVSVPQATAVGLNVFKVRVHPGLVNLPSANTYQMMPITLGALAFSKWSGSIKFKVSVVCSKFHRGRFSLFWNIKDPTESLSNVTNVKYLEITPGAEAEFIVPYAGTTPMLSTEIVDYSDVISIGSHFNGYFYIAVDQAITAPSAAPVGLLISVYAGDDFVVAAPTTTTLRYTYTAAYDNLHTCTSPFNYSSVWTTGTAGNVVPSIQNQSSYGVTSAQESDLLRTHDTASTSITRDVVGENVNSFRVLLKRYNFFSDFFLLHDSTHSTTKLRIRRVPCAPAQTYTGTNYVATPSMFHILMGCYAFYSGSIRHKVFITNSTSLSNTPRVLIARGSYGTFGSGSANITTESQRITQLTMNFGQSGAGPTVNTLESGQEFEIPDMSGLRMQICQDMFDISNLSDCADIMAYFQGNNGNPYWNGTTAITPTSYYGNMHIEDYFAVGDDFSFYTWTGIPLVYFYIPKYA